MNNMNTPPRIPAELLARFSGDVNVFHSNVYAQQAQGSRLGSTSTSSFGERVELERNRQSVRSYRESAIGTGAAARHYNATNVRRGSVAPGVRNGTVAPIAKPAGFREPSGRTYNPYS